MLNKLVRMKHLILIVFAALLLTLWTLALIFGNGEDKVMVLVLSLAIPFMIYGFVRLMYKIVSVNASFKALRFFYYFFLACGLLGMAMMVVEFITRFPNGLSPTLGACEAMIIATLDCAKKTIEAENKK